MKKDGHAIGAPIPIFQSAPFFNLPFCDQPDMVVSYFRSVEFLNFSCRIIDQGQAGFVIQF